MAESVPTGEQLVLLSRIAANVALSFSALATGNLETDIRTTINLIHLCRGGYIHHDRDAHIVRCTEIGRIWVFAFERHNTWRSVERTH